LGNWKDGSNPIHHPTHCFGAHFFTIKNALPTRLSETINQPYSVDPPNSCLQLQLA
jgi:hypothetical protein